MCNGMIRKLKGAVSVLLTAAMLVGLVPDGMGAIAAHAAPDEAEETQEGAEGTQEGTKQHTKVVRAVLDKIEELPQYNDPERMASEKGTAIRPFTILEIVGYEQLGEFGYLIGGCEPIKVEEQLGGYTNPNNLNVVKEGGGCMASATVTKATGPTYFFTDEKEGQKEFYYNYLTDNQWEPFKLSEDEKEQLGQLDGYYECVAKGEGYFKVKKDASGAYTIERAANGNLVWHTVNEYAKKNLYPYKAGKISFREELTGESLKDIGDKFYTFRPVTGTGNDVVNLDRIGGDPNVFYHYYDNQEYFLTKSLRMSRDEAADYSVVIKTITPEEINAKNNSEWVDYADLIYLKVSDQNRAIPDAWEKEGYDGNPINRLGKKRKPDDPYTYPNDVFQKNDLDWNVVEKIFLKVSAQEDYAALIVENSIFENMGHETRQWVNIKQYDYNLEEAGIQSREGFCNNVYKLALMTLSLNPNIVKQVFWKYIERDEQGRGIIKGLQEGDAALYWSAYTFLLMPPGGTVNDQWRYESGDLAKEYWENYQGNLLLTTQRQYAYGHVFTYNNDCSIHLFNSNYVFAGMDSERYKEYDAYVKKIYGEDSGKNAKNSSPADAVSYILGVGTGTGPMYGGSLKVLDLEPCVALDPDSRPDWKLTETAVRMMLPNFTGDIEIVHQTTAEFIGRIEDLNSTYDLIYVGLDSGAFNTKMVKADWTNWQDREVTDFNDDSMDGRVYFHVGDSMVNTGDRGSVQFLLDDGNNLIQGEEMRFPGNDITKLKLDELVSFIASGRPIAVAPKLFDSSKEPYLVDQSTYIYELVTTYGKARKAEGADGNRIYAFDIGDIGYIDNSVKRTREKVVFKNLPAIYNGTTYDANGNAAPDATSLLKPNYLQNGKLNFGFDVDADNYAYRIYVDKNRDSKFSAEEVVYSADAGRGHNSYSYDMASSLLGMVQWKIEVYDKDNQNIRSTRSGCSAVSPDILKEKKFINVLQIMPEHATGDNGVLDLSQSQLFWKYYKNPDLKEFDISITAISWDEFEGYFADVKDNSGNLIADRSFSFNLSRPVNVDEKTPAADQNPRLDQLQAVEKGDNGGTPVVGKVQRLSADGVTLEDVEVGSLSQYNMIVVGFDDAYGTKDLSNMSKDPNNRAVQYLQYFAASGKSILYTHDVTSFYNLPNEDGSFPFGITANAMLRDQMGMNRYKAVSSVIQYMGIEGSRQYGDLRDELRAYQNQNNYDWTYAGMNHGYTYYAMKRMGWFGANDASNPNYGNKVPYRYMIKNPQGAPVASTHYNNSWTEDGGFAQSSGFNGNFDITTAASKLNEGQITAYPYKIDDNLKIKDTHGQWYQLNMEDPEVTVWYCLADPGPSNPRAEGFYAAKGSGTALTYGVSPNDAANNYYIYSKGNIFYSGVGHTKVDEAGADMEAKLFVNTMISAYRQSYMAPRVEVTNPEAVEESLTEYRMQVLREFNSTDASYSVEDIGAGTIRVRFKPKDGSFSNNLSCRIRYDGTPDYVTKIWKADNDGNDGNDASYTAGAEKKISGLENDKEYYFDYPKSNLDAGKRTILFEVWNDVSSSYGTTYLYMDVQPLFQLD